MYIEQLTVLRLNRAFTQRQIAEYLGCHREVYRRYERGLRLLPINYLVKLSKLYGVTTDEILAGADFDEE